MTTNEVLCRRVVAASGYATVSLWREQYELELPPELEDAAREARAQLDRARRDVLDFEHDRRAVASFLARLQAASRRLEEKVRSGPLWAAAASAFALQRVKAEVASAEETLRWLDRVIAGLKSLVRACFEACSSIEERARQAQRVRRVRGRTYRVRFRIVRSGGEFVPVEYDHRDAIPAAVRALAAFLEARARKQPTRAERDACLWALNRVLWRLSEPPEDPLEQSRSLQREYQIPLEERDGHFAEELRRLEAADYLLRGYHRVSEFRSPVLILPPFRLERYDSSWKEEFARAVDELRRAGVSHFLVPATPGGDEVAQVARARGVRVSRLGSWRDWMIQSRRALRTSGGLVLLAASAGSEIDPVLELGSHVAPLVRYVWANGDLAATNEPEVPVPWWRIVLA